VGGLGFKVKSGSPLAPLERVLAFEYLVNFTIFTFKKRGELKSKTKVKSKSPLTPLESVLNLIIDLS